LVEVETRPIVVPPPPSPGPEPDCKVEFTRHRTTFNLSHCTKGSDDCNAGNGTCTFSVRVGESCASDSTPTYQGELANWKTCDCDGDERPCAEWPKCDGGIIGRSEYPPGPRAPNPRKGDPGHPGYYGHQCSVTTVWTIPAGVKHVEHDGFGGVMRFEQKGRFTICAAPKGFMSPTLRTCKIANVQ
jgi:hypothetical protein